MKVTASLKQAGLALLAVGFVSMQATVASADDKVLTLDATGTIALAPEWQNGSGSPIVNVDFSFGGLVAGVAARNVDSAASVVRLANPVNGYPATVALSRPTNCRIGLSDVADQHVHFLNNGSAVTADGTFDISSSSNQSYALRFASVGSYGDKAGAVDCIGAGALTYSY